MKTKKRIGSTFPISVVSRYFRIKSNKKSPTNNIGINYLMGRY